jgi:hypothetical protein
MVVMCAVVVLAAGFFAYRAHSQDSHNSSCRSYRDALTVALADPQSTAPPPSELSAGDRQTITGSRAAYQSAWAGAEAPTPGFDFTIGGSTAHVGSTPPSASDVATKDAQLQSDWKTWAASADQVMLARRNC